MILTVNRWVELNRFSLIMLRTDNFVESLYYVLLVGDLKRVLLCYLFLVLPLGGYSVRICWMEWRQSIVGGDQGECGDEYKRMDEGESRERTMEREYEGDQAGGKYE